MKYGSSGDGRDEPRYSGTFGYPVNPAQDIDEDGLTDEWDDDFEDDADLTIGAEDGSQPDGVFDDDFDSDFDDDLLDDEIESTADGLQYAQPMESSNTAAKKNYDRLPWPDFIPAERANPTAVAVYCAIIAAMTVISAFLFVSGTMLSRDSAEFSKDFLSDFETSSYNLKTDILMAADVNAISKIYYVPWNEKAPAFDRGRITSKQAETYCEWESKTYPYDELFYEDETISVHYWRERMLLRNNKLICTVHFSEIQISHPTQLRTAFAGGEYHDMTSRAEEYPAEMAKDANAVIAVNGDYYNYRETGVLIRNNAGYRFKPYGKYSWDVLMIDDHGDFHMQSDKKIDLERLNKEHIYVENGVEYNIVNTMHFGPSLVVNGEYKVISESSGCGAEFNFEEGRSRTAIGQIGELHYLLCVVEETTNSPKSYGASVDEVGRLMQQRGCQQAYNLDGGQSAVMIFCGDVQNNIYRGDARKLTDILYFASALPQDGQGE